MAIEIDDLMKDHLLRSDDVSLEEVGEAIHDLFAQFFEFRQRRNFRRHFSLKGSFQLVQFQTLNVSGKKKFQTLNVYG